MAWTTIADANLDPDAPARSVDALALRDNPIAIANGDSGAPRIVVSALDNGDPVTGAVECWNWALSGTTVNTAYQAATVINTSSRPVRVMCAGVIRANLDHFVASGGTSFARVLKNGVQEQEWSTTSVTAVSRTADVTVAFGDVIVFQHRTTSGSFASTLEEVSISADAGTWVNSSEGI